jgi:hypothetical protein
MTSSPGKCHHTREGSKSPSSSVDALSTVGLLNNGGMAYRYEDLGSTSFQKMCQSLLVAMDSRIQCPPTGQSDGGRDAFLREPRTTKIIANFQIKWMQNPSKVKNPATWLASTVKAEDSNIRRMVKEGLEHYTLITNISGSSQPKVGQIDLLDEELTRLGKRYSVTFSAWWRDDLDAKLNNAPAELKFEFPDMLVGADAMRALLDSALTGQRIRQLEQMLRAAAAKSFGDDRNVSFRQGSLDGVPLHDLFVDVGASPKYNLGRTRESAPGAMELFRSSVAPRRAMMLGAPGQGKSTLLQYLCQIHRAHLLDKAEFLDDGKVHSGTEYPRVAFKVVLRDFSTWLAGRDPFSVKGDRRPRGSTDSLESYIAHSLHLDSGGHTVSPADITELTVRFPTLFALDGLDEVADAQLRARVVAEIMALHARVEALTSEAMMVVTARPSYNQLPEPSDDVFVAYNLDPLSEQLRIEYLRKWTRVHGLSHPRRHEVERIFRERSGEPHVRELATNPMQLTILLSLINQRGTSIPRRRTELYADYLKSFLDRESVTDADVLTYRDDLEEVTGFLGWHLQSQAELKDGNGREPRKMIERAMRRYLADHDRDTRLVDTLFTAITTRVWALTSRVEGTFEFDIQSIREYFAARHLFDQAPAARPGSDGADRFTRFREVASRPYWANTARFMAGLFPQGEKPRLADDLDELIDEEPALFWPRRLALTLVRDGIFDQGPSKARRRLLTKLHDDLGVRINTRDIDAGEVRPVSLASGGDVVITMLKTEIEQNPNDQLALERTRLLSEYLTGSDMSSWWFDAVQISPSTSLPAWLEIGIVGRAGEHLTDAQISHFDVQSPSIMSALLAMGAVPAPDTSTARAFLDRVLAGSNQGLRGRGQSAAANLARVVDLPLLIERAAPASMNTPAPYDSSAPGRLRQQLEDIEPLLRARRGSAGQKGTTLLWSKLAETISGRFGRCWLAYEVALIGASAPSLHLGHNAAKTALPFGPSGSPAALLRDTRTHINNPTWWAAQHDLLSDDLDHATWALAVITVASPTVITAVATQLGSTVTQLGADFQTVLEQAVRRLGNNPDARTLPPAVVLAVKPHSLNGAALLALFAADDALDLFDLTDITRLTHSPLLAYPHLRALWSRVTRVGSVTPNELACLESGGSNIILGGLPDTEMTPETRASISVRSPWALVRWSDRSAGPGSNQDPLAAVAEKNSWFEPED